MLKHSKQGTHPIHVETYLTHTETHQKEDSAMGICRN